LRGKKEKGNISNTLDASKAYKLVVSNFIPPTSSYTEPIMTPDLSSTSPCEVNRSIKLKGPHFHGGNKMPT